jgi:hypothetical protein
MLFALIPAALADSVAVLPLDGRGVSGEEAAAATEVLRDTLGLEGLQVPLGTEMAAALTAGHEDALQTARTRYAEGRAALAKARPADAVRVLDESARLHITAGSAWARRIELADVAWSLAEARLAAGDPLAAREDLTALAQFWPAYAASHPAVKGTAARMLAEVDEGLARTPWSPPDEGTLAGLLAAAGTDALVLGSVNAGGAVRLLVYTGEASNEEVTASVQLPVNPAGLEWEALAGQVATLLRSDTAPAAAAPTATGPALTAERGTTTAREPEVSRSGRDETVRIRTVRGSDPTATPITSRWWFWVGMVALVGGGTSAAVAAAQPAPVVTEYETPSYAVVVTPP